MPIFRRSPCFSPLSDDPTGGHGPPATSHPAHGAADADPTPDADPSIAASVDPDPDINVCVDPDANTDASVDLDASVDPEPDAEEDVFAALVRTFTATFAAEDAEDKQVVDDAFARHDAPLRLYTRLCTRRDADYVQDILTRYYERLRGRSRGFTSLARRIAGDRDIARPAGLLRQTLKNCICDHERRAKQFTQHVVPVSPPDLGAPPGLSSPDAWHHVCDHQVLAAMTTLAEKSTAKLVLACLRSGIHDFVEMSSIAAQQGVTVRPNTLAASAYRLRNGSRRLLTDQAFGERKGDVVACLRGDGTPELVGQAPLGETDEFRARITRFTRDFNLARYQLGLRLCDILGIDAHELRGAVASAVCMRVGVDPTPLVALLGRRLCGNSPEELARELAGRCRAPDELLAVLRAIAPTLPLDGLLDGPPSTLPQAFARLVVQLGCRVAGVATPEAERMMCLLFEGFEAAHEGRPCWDDRRFRDVASELFIALAPSFDRIAGLIPWRLVRPEKFGERPRLGSILVVYAGERLKLLVEEQRWLVQMSNQEAPPMVLPAGHHARTRPLVELLPESVVQTHLSWLVRPNP